MQRSLDIYILYIYIYMQILFLKIKKNNMLIVLQLFCLVLSQMIQAIFNKKL